MIGAINRTTDRGEKPDLDAEVRSQLKSESELTGEAWHMTGIMMTRSQTQETRKGATWQPGAVPKIPPK